MTFDAIDEAFHYVSNAPPGERSALLRRSSGEIFLASHKAGFDERPPGSEVDPDCVAIPHRQQLDPGMPLILDFVRGSCPQERGRFEALFARPGGFRNAKDLLRRLGLLEGWQLFEEQQLTALLRQWCSVQGITLDEVPRRR
jgi:hypothetical protein